MPIDAIKFKADEIANQKEIKTTYPKTEPYPNDSVELSKNKEKKKLNKLQKVLFGCGSALIALAGVGLLIFKHHGNRIKKLYDEKLVIRNLKEKIDFKEAKTVEDGIKFAKEVLGIKEIDKDFTLEAINYANKGLVDVSNANKGRVFMPYALKFTSPVKKNEYIAAVEMNINSREFGNMYINRHYFDQKYLDERLNKQLFLKEKPLYVFDKNLEPNSVAIWDKYIYAAPSKDVAKLIDAFYKDSSTLTVEQKRDLFYSLSYGRDGARRSFRNPIETLKHLEKTEKEFLQKHNIKIDYDILAKASYKTQKVYLLDLLEKMKKENICLVKRVKLYNPLDTVYHEMGHLQDAAKNLKQLDLKQWKFNWKEEWKSIRNRQKSDENVSRIEVDEVDNRWGSIAKEEYEKMLENSPKEFKNRYPEFYEFLNNKNIQQTAGKISSYSQTGIGEFIAETYAKMIAGKKIPEDVMNLYRKYQGPEILQAA